MWRYKDLLPVEGEVAVGFTPLVRERNLAAELGVAEVYINRLAPHAIIRPSLSAFDLVLPDLESHAAQEER